ncbi:MAG: tRNA (adenosine(37)-N6)-dimethylallyltransferase MiaA [Magnetococcales bacterium]|nr:tRNA (adenosine(37)-N6)-dimethylallyltransferase MiaA [Magnetococcales bacterium]
MNDLLAVVGATASGKTGLGVALARALDGEIISADSRQLFRGMDIGTGKDLPEYEEVPYHLIDCVDPGESFSLFDFQRLAYESVETIRCRGKFPLLVGGSGLYLDSILGGYRLVPVPENPSLREALASCSLAVLQARLKAVRPSQHNVTDLLDRDRLVRAIEIAEGEKPLLAKLPPPPPISALVLGIRWPRSVLRQRITQRLRQRLAEGMVEEVEGLLAAGVSHEQLYFYGLEYRFISRMLRGELDRESLFQHLNHAIHHFAKRQDTWFRRMEKRGVAIVWLPGGEGLEAAALESVEPLLAKRKKGQGVFDDNYERAD